MLKIVSYDIVFQEIPGEVTLALNISGCLNRCPGCHSPHLHEDIGELLDNDMINTLISRYKDTVTCVCFMGGDADPCEVAGLALYIRSLFDGILRTAWYSGRDDLPENFEIANFDYVKIGSFQQELGGLKSPTTNQKLYRVENSTMIDITHLFLQFSPLG